MDYWMQQNENVCELCGGAHDTRQCANSYESMQFACNFQGQQYPVSNTYPYNPNFSWSNDQYGMQQSYQQSSPYQNQQYGAWPYESSEMQQAYESPYSFQNQQYGAWPYDPSEMHQSYEPSYSIQNQQCGAWPYEPSEFQHQQGQQFDQQYAPWQQQFQPPEFQQQQFQTISDQQSNEKVELEELRSMIKSLAVSHKTLEHQFEQIANALLEQEAEQEAHEAEQRQRDVDSVVALLLAQPRPIEVQPAKDLGVEQEAEKETEPEASNPENSENAISPENSEHSVLKNQPQPSLLQSENSEESAQNEEKAKAMQFPLEDEESFIVDIKGISTSDCMLKILLERGNKPFAEQQERLYPIMEEGVKEEIIKWPMVFDMKAAGEKKMLQLSELDEFRHQAYENSKLLKEQIKKWLDKQLAYKALHPP